MSEFVILDDDETPAPQEKKKRGRNKKEAEESAERSEARGYGEPSPDLEVKRESLLILASVGETKKYVGEDLSMGDVQKLSPSNINEYFRRYTASASKEASGTLMEGAVWLLSKAVSFMLPIDDAEKLREDLMEDKILNREMKHASGMIIVKGGRLVALASALTQVARHVKFSEEVRESSLLSSPSTAT